MTRTEDLDGEHELEVMAEIARRLADADGLDNILHRVVLLAEDCIDDCDGVSLMLIGRKGSVACPAFSSQVAYDSDQAQFATNQGPCLEAIREHETAIIDDLADDDRWPSYRRRVLELGIRSVLGVRLFQRDDTLGALSFYSSSPHTFGTRSRLLAQVFAAHAAVAMKAAIAEAGAEAALQSRDVIGQAKGVLIAHEGLTGAEAFTRLRELSQQFHWPLRELAEEIATSGQIPPAGT